MKTLAHDVPDIQSPDTFQLAENEFERVSVIVNRMLTNLARYGDTLHDGGNFEP